MNQVKFVDDQVKCKIWSGRPHRFKFFQRCLPQTLLGPFLNTLTHTSLLFPSECCITFWSSCFDVEISAKIFPTLFCGPSKGFRKTVDGHFKNAVNLLWTFQKTVMQIKNMSRAYFENYTLHTHVKIFTIVYS